MLAILHASARTPELDLLLADLQRYGIPAKVYGMGSHFQNWGDKLRSHYKAACEHPGETLLCLDAYDVRVIGPVNNYDAALFSAEKGCFPCPELAERYPEVSSKWRYLNAGVWIAPADWIRRTCEANPIATVSNDQEYWSRLYLDDFTDMFLDANCQRFQSAAFSHRGQFADYGGKLTNLSTMSTPSILHFNGKTQQWMPDGMTALAQEANLYRDREDEAKRLVEMFRELVNETPWLAAHRNFAEAGYGCGDRSFHWLWHLLAGEMPASFKFMEIGVYKGQVLSLVKLLADKWGKQADVSGVTMLSDFSGDGEFPKYEDRDYLADITAFHVAFRLPFDPSELIVGDSTASWVIDAAKHRGPLDLLYIDGCHEYGYVKSDIEHYAPLVKPGGYLVMDDAACGQRQPWGFFQGIEQVTRAVRDTIEQDERWEHVLTVMHNRVFRRK